MAFECKTNISSPTYAWTVSPSTATLSTTLNASTLTVPKNTF